MFFFIFLLRSFSVGVVFITSNIKRGKKKWCKFMRKKAEAESKQQQTPDLSIFARAGVLKT